jgi:tetratricopeptide (TPR) repeat protein
MLDPRASNRPMPGDPSTLDDCGPVPGPEAQDATVWEQSAAGIDLGESTDDRSRLAESAAPPPGKAGSADDFTIDLDANAQTAGSQVDATVAAARGHRLVSALGHVEHETRGRYTMTHLHAKGGIGQVWLARDVDLGREVALKEIRPERSGSNGVWARFLAEARITGQLEHPGIVPIYELACKGPDQLPYYTMRFVRGRTLGDAAREYHDRLGRDEAVPLDLAALVNAFGSVCQAMAYAHSRGIIHRDLKGQNIVLGDYGEVMVLDWGLAKNVDAPDPEVIAEPRDDLESVDPAEEPTLQETAAGQVMGTPAYMAPEQAEGNIPLIGRSTDVYGLGAVLYEILTGQPPFRGDDTRELLRKVIQEPPVPPRQLNPMAPPALEAICLKAMAKLAGDRYASAADLALEIRTYLADEPVTVYREPFLVRAGRWARRHRTAVACAAAALVVACASLALGTVLVGRERDLARVQRQVARRAVDDMYTDVAEGWLEDHLDDVQRTFLERALAYYERFADQEASDPAAVQERGRASLRMGDILRKLGRQPEAERAYRRGVEVLGRLADEHPGTPEHRHQRAVGQARLGAALAAGGHPAEAETLDRDAIRVGEALLTSDPGKPAYLRELAVARKELADLLRLQARPGEAERLFASAVAGFEALADAPGATAKARQDLASTLDRQGLLFRELGRFDAMKAAYDRALAIQRSLAEQAPTLPAYRESLANAETAYGLLLSDSGRLADAEPVLARAVAVNETLVKDFPLRPEFRRDLARSQINLANLLQKSGRPAEAVARYAPAAAIFRGLTAAQPRTMLYRHDLGRLQISLGAALRADRKYRAAGATYREAISTYEALIADQKSVPAYRQGKGDALMNLGELQDTLGKTEEAERAYKEALQINEDLARDYPGIPDYQRGEAKCLVNLSGLFKPLGRREEAEDAGRRGVLILEKLAAQHPENLDDRLTLSGCLNNLAALRLPDADATYARIMQVNESLVADHGLDPRTRQMQALTFNNLGELKLSRGDLAGADREFGRSVELFDALVAGKGGTADDRSYLGYVLGNLAAVQVASNRPAEARPLLERAAGQQREALKSNPNGEMYRLGLVDHDTKLAETLLALGEHAPASDLAAEIPEVALDKPAGGVEAARLLARCIASAEADGTLPDDQRKARAGEYADRAIVLLGAALQAERSLADQVKTGADFAPLRRLAGPALDALLSASVTAPTPDPAGAKAP